MLSASELAYFRRRLLDREAELRRHLQVDRQQVAYEPVSESAGEVSDFEDTASTEQLNEQSGIEVGRELAELREVQLALGRIEAGGYGTCQQCGRPIPRDRLEAVPAARYDLAHQGEAEQGERGVR